MKSEKRIKLTDKQFSVFQQEAEYWLDKFSLRNWDVYYGRISETDEKEAFASCSTNIRGRNACLNLATDYGSDDKYDFPRDIHEYAFHEVCELLLAELNATNAQNEKLMNTMTHDVIRRLEHVVFRPDWERRQKEKER